MSIIAQSNTWANLWGRVGGREPQRSDLWYADFTLAVNGLNSQIVEGDYDQLSGSTRQLKALTQLSKQHCISVSLPELSIKSDSISRATVPYQMPSMDEPCSPIRVQFILDASPQQPNLSPVYNLLEAWRAFVRAGRGGLSSEPAITLSSNFTTRYAFNVTLYLACGVASQPQNQTVNNLASTLNNNAATGLAGQPIGGFSAQTSNTLSQSALSLPAASLSISSAYVLENCWVGSYKLSDFNYENTRVTMIDAQFFAEDVYSSPESVVQV